MNSLGRVNCQECWALGHITTSYGNAHSGPRPRTPAPHARVGTLHCQPKCPMQSQRTLGCVPSLLPLPRVSYLSPCVDGSQQRTNPRYSPPGGMGCSRRRVNASRFPGNQLIFESLASATKMTSGIVTGALPSRICVSSRVSSSAEALSHRASRKRTSWSRSDS
jgi:hypothetical protein